MHRIGKGMIYCISVMENFSRAILASAISRKQDNEAFFAVLYDAVRHFGVPEVLVSDNGTVFTSHDTRWMCEQLGIEKREIKKGCPYQNYIEAAFGVRRRMADWAFESAQTWEDLLAAHDKWMRDYHFQRHFAHEKRDDGCHSPAAVLQWIKGVQPEPELVYQAFSAMCETRRLNKAGYARFRNFFSMVKGTWQVKRSRSISFKMCLLLTTTRSGSHGTLWNGNRTTATLAVLVPLVSMITAISLHN